jgi:hypothetical protein
MRRPLDDTPKGLEVIAVRNIAEALNLAVPK